jgi:hypothetical protein
MSEYDESTARNEMAAAVAVATAMAGALQGNFDADSFGAAVGPIVSETWPANPLECIPALAMLSVRVAFLLGEATGRPLPQVLADLGAEAAGPRLGDGL